MTLLYKIVVFLDGYWHVYVCNFVERHADEPFEEEA